MSMSIYAGRTTSHPEFGEVMSPVIDFSKWEEEIVADDADDRMERGESAFIPNPDYVADAGMNLSNGNAEMLFAQLGFTVSSSEPVDLPIDEVGRAVLRGLNGPAARHTEDDAVETGAGGATMVHCGVPDGYMASRLTSLAALIAKGRKLGATHIVVV